jgi:YggT family protein
MFAYTNLILFIAETLSQLLWLYTLVILASVVMSWVEASPYNPIVRAIYAMTEPVFDRVRTHMPVFFGGLDFSPFVVLIAVQFLQSYLVPTLTRILISGFA